VQSPALGSRPVWSGARPILTQAVPAAPTAEAAVFVFYNYLLNFDQNYIRSMSSPQ
jgi:hypothetical protein